ncbi:MAG: chemotaxis protein CheB, partial [Rhodobacterales bacterium]|nr:chemotaxis protein CheB [Rhodobacterales bacterium]
GHSCWPGRRWRGSCRVARTVGTVMPDLVGTYRNRTVDLLFNSLAAFGGMRIIGIVLAGSLDDGSRGLAAIKKAGGLTMVIVPSKLPPDMPGNALFHNGPLDVIGNIPMIARAVENTISDRQKLIG